MQGNWILTFSILGTIPLPPIESKYIDSNPQLDGHYMESILEVNLDHCALHCDQGKHHPLLHSGE